MASSIFVVTTIAIITIFFFAILSYADRKDEVCIPATRGYNNYAWNQTTFPESTRNVQVGVLLFIQEKLYWTQKDGGKEVCSKATFDVGSNQQQQRGTEIFVFAGCKDGLKPGVCQDCVGNMTVSLRANYPDAFGAQGVSVYCCVRYETYEFC